MFGEPLEASLSPDMAALDGCFVLHILYVACCSWWKHFGGIVWLRVFFVGCFGHIEPECVALIDEVACAQVAAGADDEDGEEVAGQEVEDGVMIVATRSQHTETL